MKTNHRAIGERGLAMLACTLIWFPVASFAQDNQARNLVVNGSFAQWEDSKPVGWNVVIGATNGATKPTSTVRQGEGPSLELSGNRNTRAWYAVSQDIACQPEDAFHLTWLSRTQGLRREGNQFDNCYIGVVQENDRGQILLRDLWPIDSAEFRLLEGTQMRFGFLGRSAPIERMFR